MTGVERSLFDQAPRERRAAGAGCLAGVRAEWLRVRAHRPD
jgi:hypothetical protein